MIDVNVSLFRWPFRRLPADDGRRFVETLRRKGVTEAWAGSFEALLDEDTTAVNDRLARACRELDAALLVPFGTVNPAAPGWRDDLLRCHERHGMPGVRLHPGYHGYRLNDGAFVELLGRAVEKGMAVQIALGMEDERTQNPLMRVPRVDASVLKPVPQSTVMLLNAPLLGNTKELAHTGQVFFDIAMIEGTGAVERLVEAAGADRVLFGSNFPLFYFEAAEGKLRESGFRPEVESAIKTDNARGLVTWAGRT